MLLNYLVVEERDNCTQFSHQGNIKDFAKIFKMKLSLNDGKLTQSIQKHIASKNEKLLYLLYQAIDLSKKLVKEHGVINYNIASLNLIVTENWELKLVDYSTVDMVS